MRPEFVRGVYEMNLPSAGALGKDPSVKMPKSAETAKDARFLAVCLLDTLYYICYYCPSILRKRCTFMEHIKTIETRNLCESAKNGGCGECQTSCQSACKTSCGIANQQCENENK